MQITLNASYVALLRFDLQYAKPKYGDKHF